MAQTDANEVHWRRVLRDISNLAPMSYTSSYLKELDQRPEKHHLLNTGSFGTLDITHNVSLVLDVFCPATPNVDSKDATSMRRIVGPDALHPASLLSLPFGSARL
jgi:hypothetical protein